MIYIIMYLLKNYKRMFIRKTNCYHGKILPNDSLLYFCSVSNCLATRIGFLTPEINQKNIYNIDRGQEIRGSGPNLHMIHAFKINACKY